LTLNYRKFTVRRVLMQTHYKFLETARFSFVIHYKCFQVRPRPLSARSVFVSS
jgi:hypothetical protein